MGGAHKAFPPPPFLKSMGGLMVAGGGPIILLSGVATVVLDQVNSLPSHAHVASKRPQTHESVRGCLMGRKGLG